MVRKYSNSFSAEDIIIRKGKNHRSIPPKKIDYNLLISMINTTKRDSIKASSQQTVSALITTDTPQVSKELNLKKLRVNKFTIDGKQLEKYGDRKSDV